MKCGVLGGGGGGHFPSDLKTLTMKTEKSVVCAQLENLFYFVKVTLFGHG